MKTKQILCAALGILVLTCSCKYRQKDKNSPGNIIDSELERPIFHYTADSNYLGDPNGLVYYKGEYHLFHQYNPYDIRLGVPQHWAHAVSRDLVHWKRLPIAIYPHEGGNIWSGSAVVDNNNTSGLQKGNDPPIVAFYTWSKDFTQCMAYSIDGGKTWKQFEGNPVVEHIYESNRDPKVFWHEPSGKWIMILYVRNFEVFVSENLKEWRHASSMELEDFHECPDFFTLPVDGDPAKTKWVVVDGSGRYYIGEFNGTAFTPESGWFYTDWNPLRRLDASGKYRGEFYATQTWSNIPPEDGRRIQITALLDPRFKLPWTTFHDQMTFPCELTLHTTSEGIRLFRWPVKEIETLYGEERIWTEQRLEPGKQLMLSDRDLLDIRATLELPTTTHAISSSELPKAPLSFRFNIRGIDVHYDVWQQEINCLAATAPLRYNENGQVEIRILVDKISLEIFGNQGAISISTLVNPATGNHTTYFDCTGGDVILKKLVVTELKSGIPKKQ
jgi:fructan beta-fructosidase